MKQLKKLNVFLSYSHKDMKYKNDGLQALKQLENAYNINMWHDVEIPAGEDLEPEIMQHLKEAHIILFFVSSAFLTSQFCMEKEVLEAIRKKEAENCVVIPIILKRCQIDTTCFKGLKRVPTDGKPISCFKPLSNGWDDAVELIKNRIDQSFPRAKKSGAKKRTGSVRNEEQVVKEPGIELIKDGRHRLIPVKQGVLDLLPGLLSNLVPFATLANQACEDVANKMEQQLSGVTNRGKIDEIERDSLCFFLMDLLEYTQKYITGEAGIRIHFRGKVGRYYQGILGLIEDPIEDLGKDWGMELTQIPVWKGLIFQSNQLRQPLLKSLNLKLTIPTINKAVWTEYLTYACCNLKEGIDATLSIGISVHKNYAAEKENLMYLLAYINFPAVLEKFIMHYCERCQKIDKKFKLEELVKNIYNSK